MLMDKMELMELREYKEFYGDYFYDLINAKDILYNKIIDMSHYNSKLVENYFFRFKSIESLCKKLEKKNLSNNYESAVKNIKDLIGVRIICRFLNDVYTIIDKINEFENITIIKKKDYIKKPKENGYRSYHIIVEIVNENKKSIFAEIQIRTISQNAWASLEHEMKYKRNIKHEKLLVDELKRCADEMASADISMQTIYELIQNEDFDELCE